MSVPDKPPGDGAALKLTPRQLDVLSMLGEGFSVGETARQLGLSTATVDGHRMELLRRFNLASTAELRRMAAALVPQNAPPAKPRPMLQHELRLLPKVTLNPRGALGSACRAKFHVYSLREAAEYVRECDSDAGRTPDSIEGLLAHRSGTIGAKQALLAALAAEAGRADVQLVVGCCEMRTPEDAALKRGIPGLNTLPLAVCWLRYKGRRLQIVEPDQASLQTAKLVTEVVVRAEQLHAERARLFAVFATDWCRAFEVPPREFARLRASQLITSAGTSIFEDLLGYGLPPDYAPET